MTQVLPFPLVLPLSPILPLPLMVPLPMIGVPRMSLGHDVLHRRQHMLPSQNRIVLRPIITPTLVLTLTWMRGSMVGKMVAEAAAKHLCPTILELGGKSPAIVDQTVTLNPKPKPNTSPKLIVSITSRSISQWLPDASHGVPSQMQDPLRNLYFPQLLTLAPRASTTTLILTLLAGQTCVRPDHLFVHTSVADAFKAALETAVKETYYR